MVKDIGAEKQNTVSPGGRVVDLSKEGLHTQVVISALKCWERNPALPWGRNAGIIISCLANWIPLQLKDLRRERERQGRGVLTKISDKLLLDLGFLFSSALTQQLFCMWILDSFSEQPATTERQVRRDFSDSFWCNTPEKFQFQRTLSLRVYKVLVNRTAFVKTTIFVYTLQAQESRH